jgi:hypothetical protein
MQWCACARAADGSGGAQGVRVQAAVTTGVGRRGWRRNKRRRDGRRCDDGRRGNAAGGGGGVAEQAANADGGRRCSTTAVRAKAVKVKAERRLENKSEQRVVSGQERNMTCGPRRFSYRRLIRHLGFEHRLIASV